MQSEFKTYETKAEIPGAAFEVVEPSGRKSDKQYWALLFAGQSAAVAMGAVILMLAVGAVTPVVELGSAGVELFATIQADAESWPIPAFFATTLGIATVFAFEAVAVIVVYLRRSWRSWRYLWSRQLVAIRHGGAEAVVPIERLERTGQFATVGGDADGE
jgi:hypothetical protein